MAVFLSFPAASSEEAAGMAAHQHLILRLAQDLGRGEGQTIDGI